MSYLHEPLRIISVQLPDEALKSHRTLNDGNPDLYPVIVGFSRPVNAYERLALRDFGVIGENDNHHWALIEDTTLEAIADQLDEYHSVLDSAVEKARQMREEAEAEDERLRKGTLQLVYRLRQEHGLDAPHEDESWRKS
ncbi:hypothetical protein [Mycobacterium sp. SA01]|uniref:hypothetical protein n=1 Tax=Mycobacterium sp. SA01 TaxID=3238820 RepID=UPI00351B8646